MRNNETQRDDNEGGEAGRHLGQCKYEKAEISADFKPLKRLLTSLHRLNLVSLDFNKELLRFRLAARTRMGRLSINLRFRPVVC